MLLSGLFELVLDWFFVLEINWDDVFSERSGMNDPWEAHGIGMFFPPLFGRLVTDRGLPSQPGILIFPQEHC